MKIQHKLTVIFSFVFGLILLLFIIVVYHYYRNKVHADYFERLHLQAAVKVDLIDGGMVDRDVLHLLFDKIRTIGVCEEWFGTHQLYGMYIQGQKGYYMATAMGYDIRGMGQLSTL